MASSSGPFLGWECLSIPHIMLPTPTLPPKSAGLGAGVHLASDLASLADRHSHRGPHKGCREEESGKSHLGTG
jgi:hypothetical protein